MWRSIVGLFARMLRRREANKPAPAAGIAALGPKLRADGRANRIVEENTKQGAALQLEGSIAPLVEGFATKSSYDHTEVVQFCIQSAHPFELRLYRLGYYDRLGARHVKTFQGRPENTDAKPKIDYVTGLVSCNWNVSPIEWNSKETCSGLYVGELVAVGEPDSKSYLYFVIREDDRKSDILVATSDPTWQAYNEWGGASLYFIDSNVFQEDKLHQNGPRQYPGECCGPWPRALEVSYDRPYRGIPNSFDPEWRLIYWLERNGYNVKYCSAADVDKGDVLSDRQNRPRVFVSSGHDEYWAEGQRANVEKARNDGIHLAFLSGDVCFWQTRFEDNYRRLVCLKESLKDLRKPIDKLAGAGWTGYWGDPDLGHGRPQPETDLTGLGFKVRATIREKMSTLRIKIPAESPCANHPLWTNTGFRGVGGELPTDTLYYEWDGVLLNEEGAERRPVQNGKPLKTEKLSETKVTAKPINRDANREILVDCLAMRKYGPDVGRFGDATHHLLLFKTSSNSFVFSAGTVYWSAGLKPDPPKTEEAIAVRAQQQLMVNLLGSMGCMPASLQHDLEQAF